MGPSVARVAGTGVLGLDPAGAVVALTAVTLGAGRRALSALVVSYYVTIVCLGVGATYATRMLSGTDTVRRWTAFGRVHHLLGLAECAVGALLVIAAAALGVISYVVGRSDFTTYLDVHYVEGTGEIMVFVAGLVGGGLGFLWYNAPPAAVFMGDTGSLALGGALGAIAVATKHEIVLAIVGGLFVVEALSVIIQVLYFKRTGRRVFLMAPIHHHFEKKGWAEPQIVIRFWIISLILAMIGLATLKVR